MRFAIRPSGATLSKCASAKGVVAALMTIEEMMTAAAPERRRPSPPRTANLSRWRSFQEAEHGNQRAGGRKGHLETRRHDGFGLNERDQDHGESERTGCQRRTVKQDRAKEHRCHQEGPLGRHAHAGDDEIAGQHDQGRSCGRLLHRHSQGKPLPEREAAAHKQVDHATHQSEMQSRNREQMGKAGGAKGFAVSLRHETAVSRDERSGETSGLRSAGDIDPFRDAPAQRSERETGFMAIRRSETARLAGTEDETDTAKRFEMGVAREVIIARESRSRRRSKRAIAAHESARKGRIAPHLCHADENRCLGGGHAGHRMHPEPDPRTGLPRINAGHPALHHDAVETGRKGGNGRARIAQRSRSETGCEPGKDDEQNSLLREDVPEASRRFKQGQDKRCAKACAHLHARGKGIRRQEIHRRPEGHGEGEPAEQASRTVIEQDRQQVPAERAAL